VTTYRTSEYRRALERKGFRLDRKTDDNVYYFYYDGKKTSIHTKVSMGRAEDIRPKLFGMIRSQLQFDTSEQLREFIECPMEYTHYVAHLKSKNILQPQ
jgi:hypothetical protein